MEGYLGEYKRSNVPTIKPQTPTQSATTNVMTYGASIVTVDYPGMVVEGSSAVLSFNRTGDIRQRIALHVLTNGFWLADIVFNENDNSTKICRLPVTITNDFDDGRKITVYLRTLDRSVVTRNGTDTAD